MSRRRRGRDVHGVVLLDKPAGGSSNRVLQQVRRLFDARKAGHTGSLDPFATGLLPICLGEASKTAGFMLDDDKRYTATLRLGAATDTADLDGEVIERCAVPELGEAEINAALTRHTGEISQVPPMYSALKVEGKPLYRLAREGRVIERKPRPVCIHQLVLLDWSRPDIHFEVHCSKGTYVRTLGEDIARSLGSCGHLTALRRTGVGMFDASAMVTLDTLEEAAETGDLDRYLLPPDAGLADWPVARLTAEQATRYRHGNPVPVAGLSAGRVRVRDADDRLLGLAEVREDGLLRPTRVFQLG